MLVIAARIKKSTTTNQIKFKIRCNRFLYTLILKDSEKADKIKQSLPPGTFHSRTSYFMVFMGSFVHLRFGRCIAVTRTGKEFYGMRTGTLYTMSLLENPGFVEENNLLTRHTPTAMHVQEIGKKNKKPKKA